MTLSASGTLNPLLRDNYALEKLSSIPLEGGATLKLPISEAAFKRAIQDGFVRVVPGEQPLRYVSEDERNRSLYRPIFLDTQIQGERVDRRVAPERVLVRQRPWNVLTSTLQTFDAQLGISSEIHRIRCMQSRGAPPPIVLEWGIGHGRALAGLAYHFREIEQTPIRFIGYADQFYPQWHLIESDVELIWDRARTLSAYLSNRPVDLIYSYWGLTNYLNYDFTDAIAHLGALIDLLKPGGVIRFEWHRGPGMDRMRKGIETLNFRIGSLDNNKTLMCEYRKPI